MSAIDASIPRQFLEAPDLGDEFMETLRKLAAQPMTPAQRRAQRVSFIMGTLPHDSPTTRAEVEDYLEREGL